MARLRRRRRRRSTGGTTAAYVRAAWPGFNHRPKLTAPRAAPMLRAARHLRRLSAGRAPMASFVVLRTPLAFFRLLLITVLGGATALAAETPAGRAVMSFHVTIAPSWFDPSTAPPQIT